MIKRLLLILALCGSAWATTTVSGNIKNLGTGAVTTGSFVRFYLRGCGGNQPRINGTALIAPTVGNVYYFDFVPNGSGAISGTLYSSRDSTGLLGGDIECGGSTTAVWYGMVAVLNGKAGPETAIHAKNSATIDISNITPLTTNPVITAPTGDSTYLRLDAGNSPLTGNLSIGSNSFTAGATITGVLTAQSVGNILYVGPGGYATIAAAVTAAGSNKTLIIVQSNYAGTECPTLVANITYQDFRGNAAQALCVNNVIEYNTVDAVGLAATIKQQSTFTSITAGTAVLTYWPITNLSNATLSGATTLDGVSTEAITIGTLSGTLTAASGNESVVAVRSTGGTVALAMGVQGYVADAGGATTAITNARGVDGIGCQPLTVLHPTNCYGLYGREQLGVGGTRNYSFGIEGTGLLKYSQNLGSAGLDMEDTANATHSFILYNSGGTSIRAVDAAGLFLRDSGGTSRAQWVTSNWVFAGGLLPSVAGSFALGSSSANWFALHLNAGGGGNDNAIIGNAAATNANATLPKSTSTLVGAVGSTLQKSETGADTNVLTVTPPALTGNYRICISMAVSAQNTATLGWTATWTDSNGSAQAPTNLALTQTGVAAPALTFTAATNGNYGACQTVDVNNSGTNIVVKTTFAGTSIAYKVSATVEGLQ